jgi:ribosome-associated protein
VETSLDADKAERITTIDLRGQSALADFMVIASGRSSRQVSALAEKLRDRLKARGVRDIRIEGVDKGDWAIVDAGDIIVHIFRPEVRDYYDLEKMWQTPHLAQAHKANVVTL